MSLINTDDARVAFRTALFTQSLYFAACICIALFFRFFFRAEWMRYVLWGGWFLTGLHRQDIAGAYPNVVETPWCL